MKQLIFAFLLVSGAVGCGGNDKKEKKEEFPPCERMEVGGFYFLVSYMIQNYCTDDKNEFDGFTVYFREILQDPESCASILSFESDQFSFYGLLGPPIPPEGFSEFIAIGQDLTPEYKSFLYIGEFASMDEDLTRAEFHGALLTVDLDPASCTDERARKSYLVFGTRPPKDDD